MHQQSYRQKVRAKNELWARGGDYYTVADTDI